MIYCTGTRREPIYKVTFQRKLFERVWQNNFDASKDLLGSSIDSEENYRSKGGAILAPGPSARLGHGRRPRPE